MRLLHTETLHFQEFYDDEIPRYAILSHRWGDQEVSFKEMKKPATLPQGPGLAKLRGFCRLAAEDGFNWCWIDTCCIDKRSSADLSEAINSMFKWYRRAAKCYVHLNDVVFTPHDLYLRTKYVEEGSLKAALIPSIDFEAKFRDSSWFTRGWTLQELIAPIASTVYFYDGKWNQIGGLYQLQTEVSSITGIESKFLGFQPDSVEASVAKRMSWASHRQTSRGEDIAYCLLGIFDVNMPLLYGEGASKAFYRLQLEIAKNTSDESLFAWSTGDRGMNGMLARSPKSFSNSGDIERKLVEPRPLYSIINRGLEFSVPSSHVFWGNDQKRLLFKATSEICPNSLIASGTKDFLLYLHCYREKDPSTPLVITLLQRGYFPLCRANCLDQSELPQIFQNYTFALLQIDSRDTTPVYVDLMPSPWYEIDV